MLAAIMDKNWKFGIVFWEIPLNGTTQHSWLGWMPSSVQSINQSINFNLNSHKHFYSVEKKKIEYI